MIEEVFGRGSRADAGALAARGRCLCGRAAPVLARCPRCAGELDAAEAAEEAALAADAAEEVAVVAPSAQSSWQNPFKDQGLILLTLQMAVKMAACGAPGQWCPSAEFELATFRSARAGSGGTPLPEPQAPHAPY